MRASVASTMDATPSRGGMVRASTISALIIGVVVGLGGLVLGVYVFADHSGGKLWFYWIAPLLGVHGPELPRPRDGARSRPPRLGRVEHLVDEIPARSAHATIRCPHGPQPVVTREPPGRGHRDGRAARLSRETGARPVRPARPR